jgi:hypothetical protein
MSKKYKQSSYLYKSIDPSHIYSAHAASLAKNKKESQSRYAPLPSTSEEEKVSNDLLREKSQQRLSQLKKYQSKEQKDFMFDNHNSPIKHH